MSHSAEVHYYIVYFIILLLCVEMTPLPSDECFFSSLYPVPSESSHDLFYWNRC